jgi:hypothetical protein
MGDTTRRFGLAITGSEGIKGHCGCADVPVSTTSLLIWSNVDERSSLLANAYHILEADDNARIQMRQEYFPAARHDHTGDLPSNEQSEKRNSALA